MVAGILLSPSRKCREGVPAVVQQVTNRTSVHEDAGAIPGLTQCVQDPVLS